jgi:4-amino-4-deoxy-L-arabinose transferase-like glycosyltransferase
MKSKINRRDGVLASLLGLTSLTLYVHTLAPGLLYGDSGEFQTLVYSLGMTHPTGYPVYLLLGRLFTLLPIGNQAWRVNLFSAVLAGLTVACVYLIVRLLTGWRLAAATAALTLAVAPLFWYFAVIAELYIPACAFLSSVLLFLLLWRQTGKWGWLATSALLGGLSLGVHSSVALAAPGILVYLAVVTFDPRVLPKKERVRTWLTAAGGAAVGVVLALGAFLIVDSHHTAVSYYNATVQPALSIWGMTAADFNSPLERLKFLYAARQFNYAMFADPAVTMPAIAGKYWKELVTDFAPVSLILMGIGLIGLFVRRWREELLLALGWAVTMVFITNYDIFDVTALFTPTFIFLVIGAGAGLGILMDVLAWGLKRVRLEKWTVSAAALLGIFALGITVQAESVLTVKAWQARAVIFMRGTDFANYPYPIDDPQAAYTDAKAIVDAVEDNSIVFAYWDVLFPCYYVAGEEGRTGITFHETYAQEGMKEVGQSAADYIAANLSTHTIYFLNLPVGPQMHRFVFQPVHRGGLSMYQVTGLRP